MSAGLSQSAKRGRNRRWIWKQFRLCSRLFPDAIVLIKREHYVSVSRTFPGETNTFFVSLSWGNMSNGESVGTPRIDHKAFWYGDWEKELRLAYDELERRAKS